MQILKELIRIVSHQRLKTLKLADSGILVNKETKISRLYHAIKHSEVETDKEAFKLLYGKNSDYNTYLKLKSSLTEMIINNIYFVDVKQARYSGYDKAYLECARRVLFLRLSAAFGFKQTVKYYGQKTLRKARRYRFNNFVVAVTRLLKNYAASDGELKELVMLTDYMNEGMQGMLYDVKAETYYQLVAGAYGQNLTPNELLIREADNYLKRLKRIDIQKQSIEFVKFYFKLQAVSCLIKGNYEQALEHYDDLIALVSANDIYNQPHIVAITSLEKIFCFLHLPELEEEAKESIKICQEFFKKGKNNWFAFNELYILYLFRSEDYKGALGVYEEITGHQRFKDQSDHRQEKWTLYEAYLHLLYEGGVVEDKPKKKFRLEKFVNQFHILQKDTRGYYVSILIAELSFYVIRKRHDDLYEKTEYLKSFRKNHLNKRPDIRAKIFVNLILQLERSGLDYKANRQKFRQFEEQLDQYKYYYDGVNNDPEVIPYEILWEIIRE